MKTKEIYRDYRKECKYYKASKFESGVNDRVKRRENGTGYKYDFYMLSWV
jgi:hypothetical protein